jgi:hypothetical protein
VRLPEPQQVRGGGVRRAQGGNGVERFIAQDAARVAPRLTVVMRPPPWRGAAPVWAAVRGAWGLPRRAGGLGS